jgi:hypothetical protein
VTNPVDDHSRSQSGERIFRVTVRGRFRGLTKRARDSLVGALGEHDVSRAAFTGEGTLTYDAAIDFFSLRYEVRTATGASDGGAGAEAARMGQENAHEFLVTMGFGYRHLKVTTTDMSALWSDRELRPPRS